MKKMIFDTGHELTDSVLNEAAQINENLTGNHAPSNGAILLVLDRLSSDGVEIYYECIDVQDVENWVRDSEQIGPGCADHWTTSTLRRLLHTPPESNQDILDAVLASDDPIITLFVD